MAEPTVAGPPVVNERGERLLAFHAAHASPPPRPADFALVLASRGARVLLVRNARRGLWELPGGWIEPGEAAEQCALRELHEESGYRATALRALGWIGIAVATTGDGAPSIGAVFGARIDGERAFLESDEISDAALWLPAALPPDTSAIDAWLVARLAMRE